MYGDIAFWAIMAANFDSDERYTLECEARVMDSQEYHSMHTDNYTKEA